MKKITITTLKPSYLPAIGEIQTAYSAHYPDAAVVPSELYLSPAFGEGQNLFCALDEHGEVVGYAPLYPVLMRDVSSLPHTIWTEIKVHPKVDTPNEIKDQLFEQILVRSREVTQDVPGHPIHLAFQYFPSETASINYVISRGCTHTESVFTMRRDLSEDISSPCSVENVVMRSWKMESEAEQRMYVNVRNLCFPEAPIELGDWQYFMQSPMWAAGTTFAAFHNEHLVGNTAVYWNEAENVQSGQRFGYTEFVFVHPEWRGKNIARQLISMGLRYLKEHDLKEARLEVKALNQNALGLYQSLGFEVIRESRFYVLSL